MKLSEVVALLGDPSPQFEGDGWVMTCPTHDDAAPSLRVTLAASGALLLKCRAGCSHTALLAVLGVSSFGELGTVVNDMHSTLARVHDVGQPVPTADQLAMSLYLEECGQLPLGEAAAEYAAARFGIDTVQAEELGLGYDAGDVQYGQLGRAYHAVGRLVVPFRDFAGVPRGFQSRAIGEAKQRWLGPASPAVGSWSRFCYMQAQTDEEAVLITEGPGDALTAYAAGYSAVGIRGASLAPKVVPDLVKHLGDRPIVLAGDNDPAGAAFNEALAAGLLEAGVAVMTLVMPAGVKDLSDWFERSPAFVDELHAAVALAPLSAAGYGAAKAERARETENLQLLNTDYGLARFLLDHVDGDLLASPGLGYFLYEAGVWVRDELDRVRVWAHEAAEWLEVDAYERYAADLAKLERTTDQADSPALFEAVEKARGIRLRAVMRLRTTSTLNAVLVELEPMVNVPTSMFDADKDVLCVRNGIVNLRTGELTAHDRERFMTKKVDVMYRPDADAPRWLRFLNEIMPEQTDAMTGFLRRLVGYSITGETSEQAFAILHGRGANGKSVFTDVLARVFESVTVTTPFSTFEKKMSGGIPNDIAALRGSRVVLASEGGAGNAMAEDVIKRVTGSDIISARFMRGEFFEFRPTFTIFLATNHRPSFKGQDEGLWRRVVLIPFSRFFKPAERDAGLTAELEGEAEGVLAWAVRGAVEWYRDGLRKPKLVTDAVDNYRSIMDELSGFLPGVMVVRKGSRVLLKDGFLAYQDWCDEEGVEYKLGKQTFAAKLEERGVFKVKGRSNQTYLDGVALADAVEVEDVAVVPAVEVGHAVLEFKGGA